MEDHFNCAANLDDIDQERDWRELLQNWDEHAFPATPVDVKDPSSITSLRQPTCTGMMLSSNSLAMESLNPVFYSNPLPSPSSMGLHPSSMGLNPSLISANQRNSATTQPLMGLEAVLINDPLSSPGGATSFHPAVRQVQQDELASSNLRSSWLSTFLQSVQSHPGAAPATAAGLASSSSSYNNLLNLGEDVHAQGLASTPPPPPPQPLPQFSSLQPQAGGSNIDEILEQLSNDFINYGAAGSLQEQLSNALSAPSGGLMMGSTISMSTVLEGGGASAAQDENIAAAQTNLLFSTPASSVSSDGGPDDDSSSREDMSINTFDQLDDFMMQQTSAGPTSQPQAAATPLPSSDATSSRAGTCKAETSAAPTSNDQDQSKKRGSKAARVTKKPKRERGQKLAIKIESDVEVLDDGYKWRKYGQKPVKNSPYPRSYYKCTDKQCKVKKHVERQAHEPAFVVATYEGVHNHSRPDQQVQVLHSQSDVTSQQHDSFQPFVPASSTQSMSPMELLGIHPNSLFPADSQPMNLPFPQLVSDAQNTLESIDQGILQTLFHGEPRTSSI